MKTLVWCKFDNVVYNMIIVALSMFVWLTIIVDDSILFKREIGLHN